MADFVSGSPCQKVTPAPDTPPRTLAFASIGHPPNCIKNPPVFFTLLAVILSSFTIESHAQNLPGSLSFTVSGSFENGVGQGKNSILTADNNLTDGYAKGMDLHDAPASLNPTGPTGSAAFQWGTAATDSDYAHSSALWFQPLAAANVAANEYFNIGSLYYRNGTINSGTGASAVDLALLLNFSNPSGLSPISVSFTNDLINTVNTSDAMASADIVSLRNLGTPLNFTDPSGNSYFLGLTFKVDQSTIDGSLSSQNQFRVFEGGQGRADLLGRFTTTPGAMAVPEPSAAILTVLGALAMLRRKR